MMGAAGFCLPKQAYETIIGYEWPIPNEETLNVPKSDLEAMHLDRYCTDYLLSRGELPYIEVVRGSDPPDFIGRALDGLQIRIDCTQLGLRERRMVHSLFKTLRKRLLDEPRERLTHLRGLMIYVSFHQSGNQALPPRRSSVGEVEDVFEAIVGSTRDRLLGHAEEVARGERSLLHAIQMSGAVPDSNFFRRLGFEIGLNYSTVHSSESFWDEVARLAAQHDKGSADELLITASGPGRDGFIYPSEEVFAELVFYAQRRIINCNNLRRIVLHSWFNGAITQIFPEYEQIARPLFGGHVAPHLKIGAARPGDEIYP